jgi:hypothetical protein
MSLKVFSTENAAAAFFYSKMKGKKMQIKKFKNQELNTKINKQIEEGEKTMTEKSEKTTTINDNVNEIKERAEEMTETIEESINRTVETKEEIDIITDRDEDQTDGTGEDTGNTIIDESQDETSKFNFPENVTEEPRNDEEMHLKYIKHSPAMVDVYLAVSDDDGALLDDRDIERKVILAIKEYGSKKVDDVPNAERVVQEIQALSRQYNKRINRRDSIFGGATTKYRIREGMLLNIEKKLLKKDKKQWVTHFNATYGEKRLRSAQDYMKLARTPNIIRYAVYGKEILMEILRSITILGIESADPIGAFLDHYNIPFDAENPDNKNTMIELRWEIDYAIAMTKIKKAENKNDFKLGVEEDLIRKLINLGVKIDNGLIKDLIIIKKADGNINEHLEDLYLSGGDGNAQLPQIKRVTGLPRLVEGLKDTVKYVEENDTLVSRIERTTIEDLELCVTQLKSIIENEGDSEE